MNLGVAYQQQGNLNDAIACYRTALHLKPDLPEGHSNLGYALLLINDYEAASVALAQALSLKPDFLDALKNLAELKFAIGDDTEAVEIYRRCVELSPETLRFRFALGRALQRSERLQEALAAYENCLLIERERSDILVALCSVLVQLGRADEAIIRLLPCIASEPNNTDALLLHAIAIHAIGSVDQAIEILEQALRVNPDELDCLNYLGIYLLESGRVDDAIVHFEKALLISPKLPAVLGNLGNAYRYQGRYDAGLQLLKEAIASDRDSRELYHSLLFHYSIGSEVFAEAGLEAARSYWQVVRGMELPSQQPISQGCSQPKRSMGQGKIRIGILSAELGSHVVSMFISPLLEHYDNSRFELEVISTCRIYDDRSQALASKVNHSYSLQGLNMQEARQKLQQNKYDIILETSGFTKSSGIELLAERCAPVQAHYIGYHATTGLNTMDYFIGDHETVPEEFSPQFSECLWRLPRPWLACSPMSAYPMATSDSTKLIPVLGSFNQLSKIREETLSYWAAAMQQLPTSVLIVKDKATSSAFTVERIKATLANYSIEPERIFFLNLSPTWESHLLHYNLIDVALDATPWSSATTAFDALAMGVPLVAIRGACTSARMSASLVKGLGRNEWIASSPDAYAAVVKRLCSDLPALRSTRAQRQRDALESVLFDGEDMVAALQEAFVSMLSRLN